jgi:hypothetical protein
VFGGAVLLSTLIQMQQANAEDKPNYEPMEVMKRILHLKSIACS